MRRRPLLVPRSAELLNGHDGLTRLLSWNATSHAAGTRWRPDESSTPVPQRQPDRAPIRSREASALVDCAVRAPTRALSSFVAGMRRAPGRTPAVAPSGEFRHRNRDTATDCGDRIAGSARLDRVLVSWPRVVRAGCSGAQCAGVSEWRERRSSDGGVDETAEGGTRRSTAEVERSCVRGVCRHGVRAARDRCLGCVGAARGAVVLSDDPVGRRRRRGRQHDQGPPGHVRPVRAAHRLAERQAPLRTRRVPA